MFSENYQPLLNPVLFLLHRAKTVLTALVSIYSAFVLIIGEMPVPLLKANPFAFMLDLILSQGHDFSNCPASLASSIYPLGLFKRAAIFSIKNEICSTSDFFPVLVLFL